MVEIKCTATDWGGKHHWKTYKQEKTELEIEKDGRLAGFHKVSLMIYQRCVVCGVERNFEEIGHLPPEDYV